MFRFSQTENSVPPKRSVIRASTEKPQRELDSQEGGPSNVVPALSGTKDSQDAPPRPLSPAVTRFGQSSRFPERFPERPIERPTERPAEEVLEFIDARPIAPLWIDSRPVSNGPVRVSQGVTARRVVDDASQRESDEEASEPLQRGGNEWDAVPPLDDANPALDDTESEVVNRPLPKAPRQFPRAASVPANSHSRTMITANERRPLPSVHRIGEFVATTPSPTQQAKSTQYMIDDEKSRTTPESEFEFQDHPTLVSRPRTVGGIQPAAEFPPYPHRVKDVAERDSENSPSAATISLTPITMQWIALLGGFMVLLLLGVVAFVVLFTLLKSGRQGEATVNVEINNNGFAPKMLGDAAAEPQAVTMNVSQAADQTKVARRMSANPLPQTLDYSPPVPDGDSRPVMTEDWQPAPRAARTSVAYSFPPAATPATPVYPVTMPFAPQTAMWTPPTPAAATDQKEELKRQQAEREAGVAQQMLDQNLDLRAKLRALRDKAA